MKPASPAFRMILALCAMNLLLVQLTGLHFHRHMISGVSGHGTSLHLRDAGMHLHETADAHHAAGDRASHPDEDLEIDPLGAGFAKFSMIWLNTVALLIVALCLPAVAWVAPVRFGQLTHRHPQLFFLRPPSNAPPLKPSPV